jgi:cell division protein FtsI (penicillin-binding protein 3)
MDYASDHRHHYSAPYKGYRAPPPYGHRPFYGKQQRKFERRRDRLRQRSDTRILVVVAGFFLAYAMVAAQMAGLASTPDTTPTRGGASDAIISTRADIVDRNGHVLATNFATHALYAHPHDIIDPRAAAIGLAQIFPDMDAQTLYERFTSGRRFLWLRRNISPEQEQMVHDLGEPGLLFGPREMRLYPNGAIASHILGGTGFGQEAVNAAEIMGIAGAEAEFDGLLRDPTRDVPLELSIDLSIQATVEEVLSGGMELMNAQGAAAVLMDIHTGEVYAMASLPDFDPNDRPRPLTQGRAEDSPLFNRAVQGVYELGSVFKTFTLAQALELGLYDENDIIDTSGPLTMAGFRIRDFHSQGPTQTLREVFTNSSNIGTARIARTIGGDRQRAFLSDLGLLAPTDFELLEAPSAAPLYPQRWGELATMTVSYGHGISTSVLHLAAAYSSLMNGGTVVEPTLQRQDGPQQGHRVISPRTSERMRDLMRGVVTDGSASFANLDDYAIGGKTGTADLPSPEGGYYEDRTIATFASVFPADDPQFTLVVTLYEAQENSGDTVRRTAGWTAVPVAAEIIRRIAPMLDMRPMIAQ